MSVNLMCYEVKEGKRKFCNGFDQEKNHCSFCSENDFVSGLKLKTCTTNGFQKKMMRMFASPGTVEALERMNATKKWEEESVPVFFSGYPDDVIGFVKGAKRILEEENIFEFTLSLKFNAHDEVKKIERMAQANFLTCMFGYKNGEPESTVLACHLHNMLGSQI